MIILDDRIIIRLRNGKNKILEVFVFKNYDIPNGSIAS